MVNAVHEVTKKDSKRNKFVTVFGGEHSVSIGTIRACNEMFPNLTVLHIDAHADLRKSYDGSSCNHACAVYEASQNTNLIQVGIRSMDVKEKSIMNLEKTYFAHDMAIDTSWTDSAIDQMTENVYITFDLDAFDPSILPSTGTPEPGGLLWYETLDFLKQVFTEKNVVGFDIVELCPNKSEKSSDFLAAKLYYKMLSYKFQNDTTEDDYEQLFKAKSSNNNFSKFSDDDDDQ
jgi:agmatinase